MTRNEKIARGDNAKRLLEAPMFIGVVEELLAESFGAFCATDPLDDDVRESLHSDVRAIHRIKARLEYFVNDATMEVANAKLDTNQ